ncbi:tyrosine-type recombinase/integrase [Bacillus testis]|uniref:tyrosine-type recombinase/integrase n=1 Tax=Bacillus testis TaxID=1622072 RepID=UPI00067F44A8|nr:site-specific integrase [Bacillus testis]
MASIRKFKNKNGTTSWEYRIKVRDPFTEKFKEKSKRGFKTKKEAQLAAAEEEKRIAEGLEIAPIKLRDFLIVWLEEYKKGTIRKNTYEIHSRNIHNHIIPYFKNLQLNSLKPIMYQQFLNSLTEKGYSKRTVEIIHGTMYSVYDKARILNKIEKNPCEGVTIKGKTKTDNLKYIDSKDIPLFLTEAYKYGYIHWIFFKVLIETGLRKGEAAALQWTDVDLKERKITVNKTFDFSFKKEEEMFGDPKTYNSSRTITISQSLANDLLFHKKYQNQNKIALNSAYHHDLNLVLCRNDGNYMPKSTLFNSFSRILKRCNLPQIPIHSLRHTHAVLQLEAGADMKYIQTRLGHGSMQITADVYSHISDKIEEERIDKFEEYTKGILN